LKIFGNNALGFKALDQNGYTVKLSDFKGKIIYVDILAHFGVAHARKSHAAFP